MVPVDGIEPPTYRLQGDCTSSVLNGHWSEWQELNLQPRGPKPRALPN